MGSKFNLKKTSKAIKEMNTTAVQFERNVPKTACGCPTFITQISDYEIYKAEHVCQEYKNDT